MDLYSSLEPLAKLFGDSTVAIGTFDGVHLGHRSIIEAAAKDGRRNARPVVVFTFDRHPAELLSPSRAPAYITTPDQRNCLIEQIGVDALVVAKFDYALAQTTPDEFVRTILLGALGARNIVVGKNFRFGRDRTGDVAFLESYHQSLGYRIEALDPVLADGMPISSTRIRDAILLGQLPFAEAMLGHGYYLEGEVVHGRKLGRTIGYPTANLSPTCNQVVPADGIYAVEVTMRSGARYGGACSIGNRPTIEGAGRSIEVYLLDFDDDIYGEYVEVRFVRYLRDEVKFDSLEALVRQIERDVSNARAALATSSVWASV